MSSLKGISPLFDSYLRVKEKPSRYQTNCNYIQGKLSVSKKDTRMAEPAVSSSQDPDIIPEDYASDDDVCEIEWVNEILCFVDCEILRNLDADILINSSKPAPLNSHANSTSKIDRSTLVQHRNNCNKIFNHCIKLTVFNDCQKDFVSPLASFEIFPDLMKVATALKYIFGSVCKMKNVKTNVLFDRLHESLKNSRHNKVTRKQIQDKKEQEENALAEVVQGAAAVTVPKTRSAPVKIPAKQVAAPSVEATKDAKVKHLFKTHLTHIKHSFNTYLTLI